MGFDGGEEMGAFDPIWVFNFNYSGILIRNEYLQYSMSISMTGSSTLVAQVWTCRVVTFDKNHAIIWPGIENVQVNILVNNFVEHVVATRSFQAFTEMPVQLL